MKKIFLLLFVFPAFIHGYAQSADTAVEDLPGQISINIFSENIPVIPVNDSTLTGSYALIAGGSKGIGLGIAEALAKRNYDLFLIARNADDLAGAKNKLENEFRVQVEILSCDLSHSDSPETIYAWCIKKNPQLKILCNAAGMGGSGDFPELSLQDSRTMIRLNLESAVSLSHLFIPLLKINAPSYILNVGSMAGFAPICP